MPPQALGRPATRRTGSHPRPAIMAVTCAKSHGCH
jgi:hypothetical protein